MTRLFRIVLLAASLTAPMALTACEDDDPCASQECDSDQGGLSEEEEDEAPETPDPMNPCRDACAALIGECDATDPSFKVNQTACIQWCKEGGLTADESTCLAGVPCGGVVDQCFAAEQ
jgi:hypothetical protein